MRGGEDVIEEISENERKRDRIIGEATSPTGAPVSEGTDERGRNGKDGGREETRR